MSKLNKGEKATLRREQKQLEAKAKERTRNVQIAELLQMTPEGKMIQNYAESFTEKLDGDKSRKKETKTAIMQAILSVHTYGRFSVEVNQLLENASVASGVVKHASTHFDYKKIAGLPKQPSLFTRPKQPKAKKQVKPTTKSDELAIPMSVYITPTGHGLFALASGNGLRTQKPLTPAQIKMLKDSMNPAFAKEETPGVPGLPKHRQRARTPERS